MHKSIGFKILFIGALTVALMVLLALISGLISERSQYRHQVDAEIANTWSGAQTVIGPILAIPYQTRYTEQIWDDRDKLYHSRDVDNWHIQYVLPEQLNIDVQVNTEQRSRGIYSVPVYTADIRMDGQFKGFALDRHRQETAKVVSIETPLLILSVDDLRGLGGSPLIAWNKDSLDFEVGTQISGLVSGMHVKLPQIDEAKSFLADFDISFQLRGSQTLQIAAIGDKTSTELESAWPHPHFFGHFLPVTHDISEQGFSANWGISAFATDALNKLYSCADGDCYALNNSTFGVGFIQPIDVYTQSERAVKYGLMFIVLTFAAFFLIELMASIRLHIIQYGLVGCALCMFYLLLLSLSEHLPFLLAYSIANVSCCGLLGIYLQASMHSRIKGWGCALSVSMLYWMLFAILRSEDFALLMGCLLLFIALAVIMLLTKKIDWYDFSRQSSSSDQSITPQ